MTTATRYRAGHQLLATDLLRDCTVESVVAELRPIVDDWYAQHEALFHHRVVPDTITVMVQLMKRGESCDQCSRRYRHAHVFWSADTECFCSDHRTGQQA